MLAEMYIINRTLLKSTYFINTKPEKKNILTDKLLIVSTSGLYSLRSCLQWPIFMNISNKSEGNKRLNSRLFLSMLKRKRRARKLYFCKLLHSLVSSGEHFSHGGRMRHPSVQIPLDWTICWALASFMTSSVKAVQHAKRNKNNLISPLVQSLNVHLCYIYPIYYLYF